MRFVRLANALGTRLRHAIVSIDGAADCRALLAPELDVRVLDGRVLDGRVLDGRALAGRASRPHTALPRRLGRIGALIARENPGVMLTHNWGSIEWSVANTVGLRVPHLHAEDGFNPDERVAQKRRRVWGRRLALARSEVVVPSATLAAIARDVWRLSPRRLSHVPNGVDLRRFRPGPPLPPPEAWRLARGGVVVGTVAGLRGEKNVARLVTAVARAAAAGVDLRLVIAGDGPERGALEALAADLIAAGRAAFLGTVADPAPFYRCLDIFALSSDTEQMPLSLLEAMASGVAAVATDVGDVRAMMGEANAAWVTPRDAAPLAQAIARLAADPDARAAAGRANRAIAECRFDEADMLAAWSALIDRRMGQRRMEALP